MLLTDFQTNTRGTTIRGRALPSMHYVTAFWGPRDNAPINTADAGPASKLFEDEPVDHDVVRPRVRVQLLQLV